jgi:probable phosphoglycerate mutase
VSDKGALAPEGLRTRGPSPTGTRLLLVRHGEAVCNALGIAGGPIGCGGLTELGRRQAAALAGRLAASAELASAQALYTSTLPRAIETAAILAPGLPTALRAVRRAELCELDVGEADGLSWTELVERYGAPDWDVDPSTPVAPGAESWASFSARARAALERLAADHPGELVVAVIHGGVIEQALKLVYGAPVEARLRLRTENCSMTEVEYRDGRWHLLRYNDRAPVPSFE